MEVIKKEEVKKGNRVKDNGVELAQEPVFGVSLEITKEDIGNLKVIFDLALQISTKNRQSLASIITFEANFIEKLEKFLKKDNK